jgi:hypothetical protein
VGWSQVDWIGLAQERNRNCMPNPLQHPVPLCVEGWDSDVYEASSVHLETETNPKDGRVRFSKK